MAKPITLSDVAAAAKVDLSTASRVLNGGGRVSPSTRQRILDTASQLDFRPNAQAQFLAHGISKTVGILTENAPGTFTLPVMAGVTTALGRHDVATLLYDARLDTQLLNENVRKLRARRIDGLLVLGDGVQSRLHSVTKGFDVPVVYAYAVSDNPADTWFIPDGVGAGQVAARHLVGLGRKHIAHITSENDIAARERASGLTQVLSEFGMPLAMDKPLEGDWTRRWGVLAARRVLERKDEVDAIFCGNDQIALGVYGVLRAAGVRVPDDIALVGMDNWEGMVGSGDNLLTTIDPNLYGLGHAAAEFLTAATDGDSEPGAHYQECSLILGETTMGSGSRSDTDDEGLI